MDQGAGGIVYGRNVIQHPNPHQMVKALMAIVHHGAGADAAALLAPAQPAPADGQSPDMAALQGQPARPSAAANRAHR